MRSYSGEPMSRPLTLMIVCFALFIPVIPALSQCTLPAPPNPATIDTNFDNFFKQNGPGWTGGDGSYSLLLPDGTNLWIWSDSYIGTADPVVVQTSPGVYKIKIMLMEWTGFFKLVGNSLATLSWPSLSIDSVTPVALPDTSIEWGTRLVQVGSTIYIYGLKDPGNDNKTPYLARTQGVNNLTNPA